MTSKLTIRGRKITKRERQSYESVAAFRDPIRVRERRLVRYVNMGVPHLGLVAHDRVLLVRVRVARVVVIVIRLTA